MPGTLTLHVAERVGSGGADAGPVLLALSGGPGQAGAILAGIVPDVAESFGVDTSAVTVIGVDQRGTGEPRSSAPASSTRSLADLTDAEPGSVEACGRDLGGRRGLYRTADTIADLEDVARS